jgi:putative ABC transport system permease protein
MDFLFDLRYGARQMRMHPVFASIVVITIALGIGANAAVFSLVYALLLRELPVRAPEELVRYRFVADRVAPELGLAPTYTPDLGVSGPVFDSLREQQSVCGSLFAWAAIDGLTLTRDGETQPLTGNWASGSSFRVLDVTAYRGRLFNESDDRPGGGPDGWVGNLSYKFWRDTWHSDPSIIGRSLTIHQMPVKIVGILPPAFTGVQVGADPQVILPLELEPEMMRNLSQRRSSGAIWLDVLGRLKPGFRLADAIANLNVIRPRVLEQAIPAAQRGDLSHFRLDVTSGRTGGGSFPYRDEYRQPLGLLQALMAVVMLLVCANLSGLLLARGASRRRELEVRDALGASRVRLVGQLLTENLLLVAIAVPLGCVGAIWVDSAAMRLLTHPDVPLHLKVNLSGPVLIVTIACALVVVALAGAFPALSITRRIGRRSLSYGRHVTELSGGHLGRYLMPAQIALSLMLTGIAVVCVTSVVRLLTTSSGMSGETVIMGRTNLDGRPEQGARVNALYGRMLEFLGAQPGVSSATVVGTTPMTQEEQDVAITSQPTEAAAPREDLHVYVNAIGPRFFETFGVAQLMGRDFSSGDAPGAPRVCVLNQSAASYFFPHGSAIGESVDAHWNPSAPPVRYEVIGVVADTKFTSLHQDPPRTMYIPYTQGRRQSRLTLALSGHDPRVLADAYRAASGGSRQTRPSSSRSRCELKC